MNVRTRCIAFTLVVSLGMLAAFAQADDQLQPVKSSPVVVESAPGTPQHFFQLACSNCRKGNNRIAAARIRDSVQLMKRELRYATASGKLALQRSIRELEDLADALEQGTFSSLDKVKAAFARSQNALAYHYHQRSVELRLQRKFKQAGQNLQAAADSVGYGLTWVGDGVQKKSRDVIVATRDLGGTLARGAQASVQRLDAQTKALGQEIKRFGLQIIQPIRR